MTIAKLRILADTTLDGFPDASTKRFIADAVSEYAELRELFGKLVYSKVITDNALLADPDVYNKMVSIFNKDASDKVG